MEDRHEDVLDSEMVLGSMDCRGRIIEVRAQKAGGDGWSRKLKMEILNAAPERAH